MSGRPAHVLVCCFEGERVTEALTAAVPTRCPPRGRRSARVREDLVPEALSAVVPARHPPSGGPSPGVEGEEGVRGGSSAAVPSRRPRHGRPSWHTEEDEFVPEASSGPDPTVCARRGRPSLRVAEEKRVPLEASLDGLQTQCARRGGMSGRVEEQGPAPSTSSAPLPARPRSRPRSRRVQDPSSDAVRLATHQVSVHRAIFQMGRPKLFRSVARGPSVRQRLFPTRRRLLIGMALHQMSVNPCVLERKKLLARLRRLLI